MFRTKLVSLAMGTTLCSLGIATLAPDTERAELALLATAPAAAGNDIQQFLFGLEVAGVYLNEYQIPGGPTIKGITTIHADGTLSSVDANDQAIGDTDTTNHGVWLRTGPREVTARQINYNFDTAGALEFAVRTDVVLQAAPDLQSSTLAGTIHLFAAGQDPLDPSASPVLSLPVSGSSRRMHVQ